MGVNSTNESIQPCLVQVMIVEIFKNPKDEESMAGEIFCLETMHPDWESFWYQVLQERIHRPSPKRARQPLYYHIYRLAGPAHTTVASLSIGTMTNVTLMCRCPTTFPMSFTNCNTLHPTNHSMHHTLGPSQFLELKYNLPPKTTLHCNSLARIPP